MFELNRTSYNWLVVDLPLWKIWVHQLGWSHSQYMELHKNSMVPNYQPDINCQISHYIHLEYVLHPFPRVQMFQTTNQIHFWSTRRLDVLQNRHFLLAAMESPLDPRGKIDLKKSWGSEPVPKIRISQVQLPSGQLTWLLKITTLNR